MSGVITIKTKRGFLQRWMHYIFKCPTFWKIKPSFKCPKCGKTYRCYWDGNDIIGHGINYCTPCAKILKEQNEMQLRER